MTGALVLGSARHAAARTRGHDWVIGGVAAELARRLDAHVGFLRTLLVVAAWMEPGVVVAYAVAALVIPRGTRRLASWSGLVAVGRFGLLWVILAGVSPGGLSANIAFELGPAIWLPLGGVALAGLLLLLCDAPNAETLDEDACRRQVLLALPVLALVAALIAGMVVFPQLRWEWFAAAAAVCAGMLVMVGRASLVFAALFAVVVVFFAGAGARFDGGIGSQRLLLERGGDLVVRRAAGQVVVDLRRVRSGSVMLHASVGVGGLEIVLPQNADVTTRLRVGRGRIDARGADAEGVALSVSPRGSGTARRPVPVTIVADVGAGALKVWRADSEYSPGSGL